MRFFFGGILDSTILLGGVDIILLPPLTFCSLLSYRVIKCTKDEHNLSIVSVVSHRVICHSFPSSSSLSGANSFCGA